MEMPVESPNLGPGFPVKLIVAGATVFYLGLLCYFARGQIRQNDFAIYYAWAYAARQGINPYNFSSLLPMRHALGLHVVVANYPPPFILILEPFTLIEEPTAFWLWSGLSLTLLVITARMLASELNQAPFYLLGFVLFFGPVADTLYWGNNESFILFLLVVMLRGLSEKRDFASGVALGLAIVWKLFPILLVLYFLILRRWRVLVYAGSTLILGAFVSHVAFKFEVNIAFIHELWRSDSFRFIPYTMNISVSAIIFRTLRIIEGNPLRAPWEVAGQVAIALCQAGMMALTVYATVKALQEDRIKLAFGLWVAAMVVLSPIIWFHRLIFLIIPLSQIIHAGKPARPPHEFAFLSYCCAEIGLILLFVRWIVLAADPGYGFADFATQLAIGCAAFISLVLAFGATFYICGAQGAATAGHRVSYLI